jgi:glycosyltransferase involved in cell wall biosynthesis
MKKKVLFILHPKLGHSTAHNRGLIYQDALLANGWQATFVSISPNKENPGVNKLQRTKQDIINLSKEFDLIYLLKVNDYSFIQLLKKTSKGKIIFDLTDALWRPNFRIDWWNLEEILTISDAIFSENEYVCAYARQYNSHVFNLPACTQTEKFDLFRNQSIQKDPDRIKAGWIGTESTAKALYTIIKPLRRLQAKYPNLDLRVVGASEQKLKPLNGIRYTVREQYLEDDMIRETLSMDIGLFPAPGDLDDYRLRGPLKALIYMSAGIPVVCLDAGEPARLIKDGENGMLVRTERDWEEKIGMLVQNHALRLDMGKRAYETVQQRHSLDNAFRALEGAMLEVLKLQRRTDSILSSSDDVSGKIRKLKFIPGIIGTYSYKILERFRFIIKSQKIFKGRQKGM